MSSARSAPETRQQEVDELGLIDEVDMVCLERDGGIGTVEPGAFEADGQVTRHHLVGQFERLHQITSAATETSRAECQPHRP